MEFDTVLGLVMFYIWGHAAYIIGKKVKGTNGYETAVLIAAAVFFVLTMIGANM